MMNNGSGSMVNRKMDLGEEGRLKYGPVKRKSKSSRPSFEQVIFRLFQNNFLFAQLYNII
jgi:hypothetical protein